MKKIIVQIFLLSFAFNVQAEDITNKYMTNFNSYLSNTLGKVFPTTEVSLSTGVTNEVTGSVLVVKPLTDNEDNIFFTQMSLFFSDDSRETFNLGIGKRKLFMDDTDTEGIVMIGEIGGNYEAEASKWIKESGNKKPVIGFIAGQTAPKGKRMGHAGAIIGGKDDTAAAKMQIMRECGLVVAESPANIGEQVKKSL